MGAQFTFAMMAVYIAVFGAQCTGSNLAMLYAYPWRVGHGEVWRLITATALHGSILHFLFNMSLFFPLSRALERWLGPWVALLMYVFFALGSGAPQALEGSSAIGASGVVYALFGFLWVCRRRYDVAAEAVTPAIIETMLAWLAICAVVNFFGGHIANTAHVFGLIFGWLVGQVVVARKKYKAPIALGTLALWGLLVALTYLPVWERTGARLPYVGRRYTQLQIPKDDWKEWEMRLNQDRPTRLM